jgi:hypothetical protein
MSKIDDDTYAFSYKGTFDGSCTMNGKTEKQPSPVRAGTGLAVLAFVFVLVLLAGGAPHAANRAAARINKGTFFIAFSFE